ncbi:12417_t:CDS:2, partial [Funneliformis mosseae]
ELLNLNPPKQQLMEQANTMWTEVKGKNTNEIKNFITNFLNTPVPLIENRFQVLNFRPVRHTISKPIQVYSELNKKNQIVPNAISQYSAISKKECVQKNVVEYTIMLNITTDTAQGKLQEQKRQLLENNVVEKYDSPGRPLYSLKNPELYNQLHICVEFSSANNRQRKE